jgi:dienelactone hydrolase
MCVAQLAGSTSTTATLVIRGRSQLLRLYGNPGSPTAIVSSGDGGWLHLAPHVAEILASRGFFVVGVDSRAYLSSFTTGSDTLHSADVPGDYKAVVAYAARAGQARPVLIGVSEGAGLSVLAATRSDVKAIVSGVVGLGLPDQNELGWHWRDALIYVTHRLPSEPMFSTSAVIGQVAPLPIAALHSTHDEFVPLGDVQRVFSRANDPKRLWVIPASDHRFSDNEAEFDRSLADALAWIGRGGR